MCELCVCACIYIHVCLYLPMFVNLLAPSSLELDRDRNSVTKKSDIEHRVCVLVAPYIIVF